MSDLKTEMLLQKEETTNAQPVTLERLVIPQPVVAVIANSRRAFDIFVREEKESPEYIPKVFVCATRFENIVGRIFDEIRMAHDAYFNERFFEIKEYLRSHLRVAA